MDSFISSQLSNMELVMSSSKKELLVTVIDGYEPFDLLRLSKDAFFDVVKQDFPNIEIIDMKLSFEMKGEEVVIRAEIVEYKEEV